MESNKKITIEALSVMMQKGINEIHEKMDEGFATVRVQIAAVNQRLDKIEETKADKADIDRVLTRISLISNQANDSRADQAKAQRRVDRHEKWHRLVAQKIGIKLPD
jgi:phenylalanyl-tRNA synthetase alpha subunit